LTGRRSALTQQGVERRGFYGWRQHIIWGAECENAVPIGSNHCGHTIELPMFKLAEDFLKDSGFTGV
jgi:hypothetical protein